VQFDAVSGGLDVIGVRGERVAEFGAVVQGQVGTFAVRGGQVGGVAEQARRHDDREQFLAGIDLILAGIANTTAPDRSDRGGGS
jgi:hypothetical protein